MTHQTAKLSTFDNYISDGYETAEDIEHAKVFRQKILEQFPYAVMLEVAFLEVDYADRWCWQNFGPEHSGPQLWDPKIEECLDIHSKYSVCKIPLPHSHVEKRWCNFFFVKTAYDFGFCEWYFANEADHDKFLAFVPSINWGENFSK